MDTTNTFPAEGMLRVLKAALFNMVKKMSKNEEVLSVFPKSPAHTPKD